VDLCHRAVFGVLGALNWTVALENMGLLEEDPVLCLVVDGGPTGPVNSVYELTHTLIRLLRFTKNLDLLLSRIAFNGGVAFGTTASADLLVIISLAAPWVANACSLVLLDSHLGRRRPRC
jgi:hypothetical protein